MPKLWCMTNEMDKNKKILVIVNVCLENKFSKHVLVVVTQAAKVYILVHFLAVLGKTT